MDYLILLYVNKTQKIHANYITYTIDILRLLSILTTNIYKNKGLIR